LSSVLKETHSIITGSAPPLQYYLFSKRCKYQQRNFINEEKHSFMTFLSRCSLRGDVIFLFCLHPECGALSASALRGNNERHKYRTYRYYNMRHIIIYYLLSAHGPHSNKKRFHILYHYNGQCRTTSSKICRETKNAGIMSSSRDIPTPVFVAQNLEQSIVLRFTREIHPPAVHPFSAPPSSANIFAMTSRAVFASARDQLRRLFLIGCDIRNNKRR